MIALMDRDVLGEQFLKIKYTHPLTEEIEFRCKDIFYKDVHSLLIIISQIESILNICE